MPGYVTTPPGLLKIVEAVLCLAGFISAMIPYRLFTPLGGGWTQFVTITALFAVVAILILKSVMAHKLPPAFPLMVLIFYLVYDVFLFIAGILTAVRAGQIYNNSAYASSLIYLGYPVRAVPACAFFVLVAFLVFVVDTALSFMDHRNSSAATQTTTSHSATTTTTVASSKTTAVVS